VIAAPAIISGNTIQIEWSVYLLWGNIDLQFIFNCVILSKLIAAGILPIQPRLFHFNAFISQGTFFKKKNKRRNCLWQDD